MGKAAGPSDTIKKIMVATNKIEMEAMTELCQCVRDREKIPVE